MASWKPLLIVVLIVLLLGGFLNFFVSPFVDTSSPAEGSALEDFSDFIQDGVSIDLPVPIFGSIDMTFNPITWLWLGWDSVTSFIVTQLNLLSYLPDIILYPLLIIMMLAFGYSIITIVRGN